MEVSVFIFDIRDLDDRTFFSAVDSLALKEKERCCSYHFMIDKKRSLVSTMLQRFAVLNNFSFKGQFSICRTKENKPFPISTEIDFGCWNYNISHHGNYIAIASQSDYLVGVDIVDIRTRFGTTKNLVEAIGIFEKQLHPSEKDHIFKTKIEFESYLRFFLYWALKESYIKAIGIGLGLDLSLIQFQIHLNDMRPVINEDNSDWTGCFVEGNAVLISTQIPWKFSFRSIDAHHVVAVALGPLSQALPGFQSQAWKHPCKDSEFVFDQFGLSIELVTIQEIVDASNILS